ncbi:hypothetical protein [Coraliomargarita parva]|uniref:hypothetical protein n=1 Tax=Coraliomargarita parva TaxID=3014050 RepID=UPI0022B5C598|nr:hypothetical protein [Coraliomargarita parva]
MKQTLMCGTLAALLTPVLFADDPLLSYKAEIIAKAKPDECFFSLYDPDYPTSGQNIYVHDGLSVERGYSVEDCLLDGGLPKTNQSYVWGMVRKDDFLWWGTGPNVNRLVSGSYFGSSTASISTGNGWTYNVTEQGTSRFVREGVFDGETDLGYDVSPSIGDWRPPEVYSYDLENDVLERRDLAMNPAQTALLWQTLGLRSAGYSAPNATHTEGLVFLAGPSITATSQQTTENNPTVNGVIMFAFDAATHACVDARSFPQYSNIRKWKQYDGVLYTAIADQNGSGQVLRWLNDPAHPDYPFAFQVVGNLNAGGAELEVHDDGDGARLFVNTWPGIEGNLDLDAEDFDTTIVNIINGPAGLWRSPIIPAGGLTSAHAGSWKLVWSVVDYEPDLVIALHYGGGAMASFDGYLYWGTMHVPNTANFAHGIAYGRPAYAPVPVEPGEGATEQELADYEAALAAREAYEDALSEDFFNSYRAISIWRGRNFTNSGGDIDLLYGRESMPVRMKRTVFTENNQPRSDFYTFKWGTFFGENIGNLRNVADGTTFYIGGIFPVTLADGGDWEEDVPNVSGYVPLYGPEGIIPRNYGYGITFPWNNYTWTMQVLLDKLYIGTMDWDGLNSPDPADGADLFCIPSSADPAVRVASHGVANWSSYGIRTIDGDDERGELYLGMANVQNLFSTAVGDPFDGGWEVQRLSLRYTDDDFDELDDEWETSQFGSTAVVNDPDNHSDSDKYSDYAEWMIGSNPHDSNSFFYSVLEAGATEGMQKIEWPTLNQRYYTLYEATDLTGVWTPVATYEGTGSPVSHEFDPSETSAKFFKVIVSLDPPAI